MSQQMYSEEEQRGYQATYTPPLSENARSYDQHFAEMPGQKLGSVSSNSGRSVSPGQRLALALVSLGLLAIGLAVLSETTGDFFAFVTRLVGVIAVCIAAAVINVVFNRRR
jgi:hypothetical protein